MRKIIFIIKFILDSFRDTNKIIKYFNLIQINGFRVIFKIFFIRFFYAFETLRSSQKILLLDQIKKFSFLKEDKFNTNEIAKEIDFKGYSKTFTIKNSLIEEITNEIFNSKKIEVKIDGVDKSEILKKENENIENYFLRLKKLKISRITGTFDLKKESRLKDFILSESITDLVRSYLNTNNFSVNASFFISSPLHTSEEEKYRNAQYFHWDNDFKKFLKLYVYLTDVDENSGPHIFIPGTHKKKLFDHKLCRLYSDDQIYSSYKDIKKFIGKAGSLFFVDSYGIHKGDTPKSRSRLLLNVHYGAGKILYSEDDIYFKRK